MSQDLTVWEYNGIELKIDLADADDAERYDKAFRAMDVAEKNFNKDLPNYEVIRNYCGLYHTLFDSIFGEGTYEKLTDGKVANINVAHAVYDSFLIFAQQQSKSILDFKNRLVSKYSPNRIQKRHG